MYLSILAIDEILKVQEKASCLEQAKHPSRAAINMFLRALGAFMAGEVVAWTCRACAYSKIEGNSVA